MWKLCVCWEEGEVGRGAQTPVKKKEKKQDWIKGEVKLWCRPSKDFNQPHRETSILNGPTQWLQIGVRCLGLYTPILVSHWMWVTFGKRLTLGKTFFVTKSGPPRGPLAVESCLLAIFPAAQRLSPAFQEGTQIAHCSFHYKVHFETGCFYALTECGEVNHSRSELPPCG